MTVYFQTTTADNQTKTIDHRTKGGLAQAKTTSYQTKAYVNKAMTTMSQATGAGIQAMSTDGQTVRAEGPACHNAKMNGIAEDFFQLNIYQTIRL